MNQTIAAILRRKRELEVRGRVIDRLLAMGIPVEQDELTAMLFEIQELKKDLASIVWLLRVLDGGEAEETA